MKKLIAMLLFGMAGQVSAADYVCSVTFVPQQIDPAVQSSLGDSGGLFAHIYSGPKCTGAYKHGLVFCTHGAPGSQGDCAKDYAYSEPALLQMLERLAHAAEAGLQVGGLPTHCNNPQSICWGKVHIYGMN
jgi:hypothetical protein